MQSLKYSYVSLNFDEMCLLHFFPVKNILNFNNLNLSLL